MNRPHPQTGINCRYPDTALLFVIDSNPEELSITRILKRRKYLDQITFTK
jgi:hypothetical protein